ECRATAEMRRDQTGGAMPTPGWLPAWTLEAPCPSRSRHGETEWRKSRRNRASDPTAVSCRLPPAGDAHGAKSASLAVRIPTGRGEGAWEWKVRSGHLPRTAPYGAA